MKVLHCRSDDEDQAVLRGNTAEGIYRTSHPELVTCADCLALMAEQTTEDRSVAAVTDEPADECAGI